MRPRSVSSFSCSLSLLLAAATPAAGQTEVFKLLPSTGGSFDHFGQRIALEGHIAGIAAPSVDDLGSDGQAYLFDVFTGDERVELQAIHPEFGDGFGYSIAIDGEYVAVGAPLHGHAGVDSGVVCVYDLATQQPIVELVPADGADGDWFGSSVAIENGVVAVGALFEDGAFTNSGSVYVFDIAGGQQLYKRVPSGGAGYFGGDVAISSGRLLVTSRTSLGAVFVYDLATGSPAGKLQVAGGKADDAFAFSLAVDGDLALVGAPGKTDNGTASGAAYLFDVATSQQLVEILPADGQPFDYFGVSVAIEGSRAVVGGPAHALGRSARLFDVSDPAVPLELGALVPSDGTAGQGFGMAAAVEGNRVVVGSPFDGVVGRQSGSAYVFELGLPIGTSYCGPAQLNSTGASGELTALGSLDVADDELTLVATSLPKKKFAYFLNSPIQGFVANPGGSQGDLCLGDTIGRHTAQVGAAGPGGVYARAIELTALPRPGGAVAVMAGETWNFTTWYRDSNPMPTSNFTDAVSLTFQ